MVIKNFVQESLDAGEVIALVSFEVQGAFDAAWWPGILRELKEYKSPKNLYKLTMNYFIQRTAAVATNSLKAEKTVTRGCPQGSCSGAGLWNLQFNSLLTKKNLARTKVVAYADDLLIATRGKSVREVENFANFELSKIERWSRRNKVRFNEKKSKVILVTRKKRREDKKLYYTCTPVQ